MRDFYLENIDQPENKTSLVKKHVGRGSPKKVKIGDNHTNGHLNIEFNYYLHKDLDIVVGVYQHENSTMCETIDLNSNLVLPVVHPHAVLCRSLLRKGRIAAFLFLGAFKPLDPEFQQILKRKRTSRDKPQ